MPFWLPAVALVVLFIVLTAVMTWPLPRHAGSAVQDLGDPLYEIWTMRWVQHQLVADAGRLWDGNVAYPFPSALLFSEPRLSTAVLAWPIQLLTGNDVLTYNVMLLSTFVLVGVGMALLVIEITDVWGAGVLAGVAAAYAPYRYGHLSHLNLLSYGWLPLALWLIVRFARRRSPIDATLAAVLLVIQVLASDTLAVMALATAGLAVLFVAVRPTGPVRRRFIGGLLLILAAPIAALLPIVRARLAVNERYGFARDLDTVREMAATLESYVSVSPGNHPGTVAGSSGAPPAPAASMPPLRWAGGWAPPRGSGRARFSSPAAPGSRRPPHRISTGCRLSWAPMCAVDRASSTE